MKRPWVVIVLVVLAVIGFGIFLKARSANAKITTAVTLAKVKRISFSSIVSSSGKTKAEKSVDLKFLTSGRLVWVGVTEGQTVLPGTVIALLDSREVQKNLEKTLRDYSAERSDFDLAQSITYNGHTPKDALSDSMRRILEKNQWDLEKSVLDVELKHLSVEYARLVTPIGGVVTHIDTPVAGVNITPATAVFQVIDPTSMVFEAKIDEVDVGKLRTGQTALMQLDAFPEATFSGKIASVAYAAETSAGGATVFPVAIAFDKTELLRVGFNGDVTIETEQIPDQLVVPSSAIREEAKTKFVYRKSGETYTKNMVKTGPSNETDTVIISGLAENDEVVTKGFNTIVVTP